MTYVAWLGLPLEPLPDRPDMVERLAGLVESG
jgi:hypothetical protein